MSFPRRRYFPGNSFDRVKRIEGPAISAEDSFHRVKADKAIRKHPTDFTDFTSEVPDDCPSALSMQDQYTAIPQYAIQTQRKRGTLSPNSTLIWLGQMPFCICTVSGLYLDPMSWNNGSAVGLWICGYALDIPRSSFCSEISLLPQGGPELFFFSSRVAYLYSPQSPYLWAFAPLIFFVLSAQLSYISFRFRV